MRFLNLPDYIESLMIQNTFGNNNSNSQPPKENLSLQTFLKNATQRIITITIIILHIKLYLLKLKGLTFSSSLLKTVDAKKIKNNEQVFS